MESVKMMKEATIGVIGGSGLYNLKGFTLKKEIHPDTPWGKPSDAILIGEAAGKTIAFLARHGRGHFLNPSEVPVRANIASLKSIGVEEIVAFSAVGSLREEIKPRDFVLPSQIIDRTKGIRPSTFFENGIVMHATFGDPFSHHLARAIEKAVKKIPQITMHFNKTLICMEGPAFSTRAESIMYRQLGGDIINMSVLPEAKLAREAEISYQMICMSTDYDSWKIEEEAVTTEMIIANLNANSENAQKLLAAILPEIGIEKNPLAGSMKNGIITDPSKRGAAAIKKIQFLYPDLVG